MEGIDVKHAFNSNSEHALVWPFNDNLGSILLHKIGTDLEKKENYILVGDPFFFDDFLHSVTDMDHNFISSDGIVHCGNDTYTISNNVETREQTERDDKAPAPEVWLGQFCSNPSNYSQWLQPTNP